MSLQPEPNDRIRVILQEESRHSLLGNVLVKEHMDEGKKD